MADYENEYFILEALEEDDVPFLTPDKATAKRQFSSERQTAGSPPLIFTNGWRARNRADGVTDTVRPILFHGNNLVVSAVMRESLLHIDVAGMAMHPAIYIDDQDNRHEDYWYVAFTELFDCWDRVTSTISGGNNASKTSQRYEVLAYGLDRKILDGTPLEKRLLFKMGGTTAGQLFCHESIAGLFRIDLPNGAKLTLVADY